MIAQALIVSQAVVLYGASYPNFTGFMIDGVLPIFLLLGDNFIFYNSHGLTWQILKIIPQTSTLATKLSTATTVHPDVRT